MVCVEVHPLKSQISMTNLFAQFRGYVLVATLTVLMAFPIVWGHGILLTFSGYVFGFPNGFYPSFAGSLIGASLCFLMAKYVFADMTMKSLQKSLRNRAIAEVLHEKGFPVSAPSLMHTSIHNNRTFMFSRSYWQFEYFPFLSVFLMLSSVPWTFLSFSSLQPRPCL
jgi:uncharacterized membrane protein YdjX (TVP38/TMEM64 family)